MINNNIIAIYLLVSMYQGCIGTMEAVFANKYDYNCYGVRDLVIVASVVDIYTCVLSLYGVIVSQPQDSYFLEWIQVGQFVISICSTITFFTIDNDCLNSLKSHAFEMWIVIILHFITLLIMICICLGSIIRKCIISLVDRYDRECNSERYIG
jgi:hypothetical protein